MVRTPDGRDLQVATAGDPAGRTVFFHHGTPGSVRLVEYVEPVAADGDLFVVTMSRAGYSTSTRREGRNAASVVADVDAVLDALGRDDYLAVGWSGGGPHALASAALGAPRCRAAFCLAGVAPIDAGFNWTEGMGPENAEEFDLALRGGQEFEDYVALTTAVMAEMTAENAIEMMGGLLSEADAAALAPLRAREVFAASSRRPSPWATTECSTTTSCSTRPGASTWPTSPCPSRSGTARTTSWCPRPTATGCAPTSRAPRADSSPTTGTSRS